MALVMLSGRGLFPLIIIPRKVSLPLFSSSIVKLSEGWISFSIDKKTEADEAQNLSRESVRRQLSK